MVNPYQSLHQIQENFWVLFEQDFLLLSIWIDWGFSKLSTSLLPFWWTILPSYHFSPHVLIQAFKRDQAIPLILRLEILQVGCMRQVLGPGALGRPRGIGWRGRWEGGLGWGIHVYPWLIHVCVWQKPLQYCKAISLQIIKKGKKKRNFFSQISPFIVLKFYLPQNTRKQIIQPRSLTLYNKNCISSSVQ